MKPYEHAVTSAKKWGGKPEDYLEIHDLIDSSKSAHATIKHRAYFHNAFGIYIIEKILGHNIINSEGRLVSVRDVAELHVIEDLGKIPSLDEWLTPMPIQQWMGGPVKRQSQVIYLNKGV
jgi:hypothetical protein